MVEDPHPTTEYSVLIDYKWWAKQIYHTSCFQSPWMYEIKSKFSSLLPEIMITLQKKQPKKQTKSLTEDPQQWTNTLLFSFHWGNLWSCSWLLFFFFSSPRKVWFPTICFNELGTTCTICHYNHFKCNISLWLFVYIPLKAFCVGSFLS